MINPADRLDRQIYVVGRPAAEVTNTKIWAQLQAQPLPERHSNVFDSECAATRPECEYVSLFIEHVPARVDVSLFEIATDPSWISVLAFAHPVFRNVTRLLGVRVVAPFRSPHAWSTLADQATRIKGTHIGPSAAPLHAHLSANPHTSIVRVGDEHSGYLLHPAAGTYLPRGEHKPQVAT